MATADSVTGVILHMVNKSSAEYQGEARAEVPVDEVEVEELPPGVQRIP